VDRPIVFYFLVVVGVVLAAIVRAELAKRSRLTGFFGFLFSIEVGFLALLLAALVFLGCLQIVLRNFFHRGLIWADPLMRHIVLWIGCLGGALATTKMRHIGIDVLTRFLPKRAKAVRDRIIYLATAAAATTLGLAALMLVLDEKSYGEKAFLSVDTWMLQAVLPAAFLVIAYRSLVNTIRPPDVKPIEWEDEGAGAEAPAPQRAEP
jgi:C4-dicarboxylate transporter, DctQ subunit